MEDSYIYVIIVLLPLSALMLVFQVNPYHALVMRAILGAVAALVYAMLGGADVALTEALVGTMLAITLYVVAIRSSLVMRLGILEDFKMKKENNFAEIMTSLRKTLDKHYLRLELVPYSHEKALEAAIMAKEVHGTCIQANSMELEDNQTYLTTIRVHRLFEIMETELNSPIISLKYLKIDNVEDKH